ncbi:MAG: hypothetical protein JO288_10205 [Hyphomicrobiales bacterium]|nr:hypothetical protein [Hyphomicrobiales bacterium]
MTLDVGLVKTASARFGGVLGTFIESVNAFNDNDWDKYQTQLDENVVAYNITRLNYVQGSRNVADYFRSISDPNDKKALQFAPTKIITWFPELYPLSVEGIAKWTHKADGHIRVPIKYKFFFSPADSFLLTAVWAEHSSPS